MKFMTALVQVCLLCLWLVGCSGSRYGADAQLQASEQTAPNLAEYRIHPGDQLQVKFFYSPELNEETAVRPDGYIALQLIGETRCAGLTPEELSRSLTEKYAKHLRDPSINVVLKSFAGNQVFVDGEVDKPGAVDFESGLSPWQAIVKAGGVKETADPEEILVVRPGPASKPIYYRIDLKAASDAEAKFMMKLQPQDVVYVPKTAIAEADKWVNQYVEKLVLFKGWWLNLNPFGSAGLIH